MESNPQVTFIIVSYNVRELLFKCISSVYKYTSVPFEIILIDNHSSDDTVPFIKSHYPEIAIIANIENAGFPKANNQGLHAAKGKYIFLINPDTEFLEDTVSILAKYLISEPLAGIVAPRLLNSDGSIQKSIFRFPKIKYILTEMFYLNFLARKKYYNDKDTNNILEVDSASGAALFFKRDLIDKVGYLNEKLFWIEDVDYCFRVLKSGLKTYYVPSTKIIHHSGQSAKSNYNVAISNMILNKIKFFKVHGNTLNLILIYLISLLNVILRIIIFGLLSPFKNIYFLKLMAYVYTFPLIFNSTKSR
jgi:GT2 family glycosyltransferase